MGAAPVLLFILYYQDGVAVTWLVGCSVDLKRAHDPKVVGSIPTPATMNDEGFWRRQQPLTLSVYPGIIQGLVLLCGRPPAPGHETGMAACQSQRPRIRTGPDTGLGREQDFSGGALAGQFECLGMLFEGERVRHHRVDRQPSGS